MKIKKKFVDVVIIGAGPGGLSAAIELSKSDKRVVLIEKNDKIGPKVCAGGLTTKVAELDYDLEIADKLFSKITLVSQTGSRKIESKKPFVGTINRTKLADIMLQKLKGKTNVEIIKGKPAKIIDNKTVSVGGEIINFKYLIGADGSNSLVRKYFNVEKKKMLSAMQYWIADPNFDFELIFNKESFGLGYAWVFPHKDRTSIGCGTDISEAAKIDLKSNFHRWLKSKKINIKNARFENYVINYDYRGHEFGNFFLVGDAAGFASGLTGEGMYFAMVSGQEVAKKILDPNYRCDEIKHILKLKRSQERFLKIVGFAKKISKKSPGKLVHFVLKFPKIEKKLIEFFS